MREEAKFADCQVTYCKLPYTSCLAFPNAFASTPKSPHGLSSHTDNAGGVAGCAPILAAS